MTLWKVNKTYNNYTCTYTVMPYSFLGHLRCCFKWYGINGLKWCYLFKRQAEHKANKLNKR
jgi:hypothetical protein